MDIRSKGRRSDAKLVSCLTVMEIHSNSFRKIKDSDASCRKMDALPFRRDCLLLGDAALADHSPCEKLERRAVGDRYELQLQFDRFGHGQRQDSVRAL